MKKQFINSIKTGDVVDDIFVLSEKNLAQKKDGNNFLNISLADKTGITKGVVWNNVDQITAKISAGDFVSVRGTATEYRGSLQLVIKNIEACSADAIDPSDFLPESRFNRDAMFERLLKLTETIETLYLKNLLEAFWNDDEFVSKFKRAPAAKKMHHAYIGGLIEHTLSMARLADKIAEHYQYVGIDRDLLITSAILHDIGKIREFDYKVKIDYSDEGRLLNHIVIGVQMIEEKLGSIKNFPDEQALLIKHMIVSHHGTRDFGSPEPPKTIEAVLLNYIDEIDSKVNGIREFIDREDPGEKWTSFHRLLERFFYIGKNQKDLTD
jgi:3'-5' exoribonuclease